MKSRLEKALRKLQRACKKLQPLQGEIARRNARYAVSAAMAALKRAVKNEYPPPPRRVVAKSRDPVVVARRQQKRGWREITTTGELILLAQAGIGVRRAAGKTWAPGWTDGIDDKHWKRAARDLRFRKVMLAQAALLDAAKGGGNQ